MNLREETEKRRQEVEALLLGFLEDPNGNVTNEAVRYSVEAGGKRLRPIFLLSVFESFKNSEGFKKEFEERDAEALENIAKAAACGLEFIHNYSLVHDDLPDMDNDMLRRGKPTTHAKFGTAMGILAGDALLTEAFNLVSGETLKEAKAGAGARVLEKGIRAMNILGTCAGKDGMIYGQEIDLLNEGKQVPAETTLKMYELKTSKLLIAAFTAGAVLGGASEEQVKACEDAAKYLGLAFQIRDDILDVISDEATLGKPINSDIKNEKCTYLSTVGMERADSDVKAYTEKALGCIKSLGLKTEYIEQLMKELVERDK